MFNLFRYLYRSRFLAKEQEGYIHIYICKSSKSVYVCISYLGYMIWYDMKKPPNSVLIALTAVALVLVRGLYRAYIAYRAFVKIFNRLSFGLTPVILHERKTICWSENFGKIVYSEYICIYVCINSKYFTSQARK